MLTVAITLVCIYIILVNVDTERLSRTFRTIPWYVFTASLSVHFLAYIFRALVFLKLLEKEKLGFRFVLLNHCIHNFYVHVVPASLGELSFPYLLRNRVSQGKSLLAVVVSVITSYSIHYTKLYDHLLPGRTLCIEPPYPGFFAGIGLPVITSYSIHYTKLYEFVG